MKKALRIRRHRIARAVRPEAGPVPRKCAPLRFPTPPRRARRRCLPCRNRYPCRFQRMRRCNPGIWDASEAHAIPVRGYGPN